MHISVTADWYDGAAVLRDILICICYVTAAVLIYRTLHQKPRLKQMTRLQYLQWKQGAEESELDKLFRQAGRPFGFTAWRWQIVRLSITILCFIKGSFTLFYAGDWLGLVPSFCAALAWLLITNGRASVVVYILRKCKEAHDSEKNRELFMVYSMIADELSEGERRLNLYSLLSKLKEYTRLIKPSLHMGLRIYDEGPHAAMMKIADDIGTPEALELCKLLVDLDTTPVDEMEALVQAREESYVHMLRENRRRRRKLFGSLAYAVAFSPLLIYLWNALVIAQNYVNDLFEHTNQLS